MLVIKSDYVMVCPSLKGTILNFISEHQQTCMMKQIFNIVLHLHGSWSMDSKDFL